MPKPFLELQRLTAYNQTDPAFLVFGRQTVPAVREVSLQVAAGETLALIGESGSGRSTLLRTAARLQPAAGGRILLDGQEITGSRGELPVRLVPQDPRTVLELDRPFADAVLPELARAGLPAGEAGRERLAAILAQLGLGRDFLDRPPAGCSGGEVQRLAIARALALAPGLLLLDEPVSGVDPHTAERVIRTLRSHQARERTAILLSTHDLILVRRLAHRVGIMLAGWLVETGPVAEVLGAPLHPHARQLIGAEPEVPAPDPDLARPASGCPFVERCPLVMDRCRLEMPPLQGAGPGRAVACHAIAALEVKRG